MEESDTPRTAVLVPSEELKRLQRERDEARAEVERLRSAVRWACGYDEGAPHFDPPEGAPRYWWRAELMRRAALAATEPKP